MENIEVSGVIHYVSWPLVCLGNPAHLQQSAIEVCTRSTEQLLRVCGVCVCVYLVHVTEGRFHTVVSPVHMCLLTAMKVYWR